MEGVFTNTIAVVHIGTEADAAELARDVFELVKQRRGFVKIDVKAERQVATLQAEPPENADLAWFRENFEALQKLRQSKGCYET